MNGYITPNREWAAVPYGDQYIVLHQGLQVHHAVTLNDAKSYIQTLSRKNSIEKSVSTRRRKSKASLMELFK